MSEPEPETKTTTKSKVVMICIIGNSFSSHFLKCWTEFLGYCLSHNIRPMLSNIIENGSFVDKNNCFLCNSENSEMQTPFQGKLEYDYILCPLNFLYRNNNKSEFYAVTVDQETMEKQ